MTLATVKSTLVSLVEGSTVTMRTGEFNRQFRHFPEFDIDENTPDRAFAFRSYSRAVETRMPLDGGQMRVRSDLELLVFYGPRANEETVDAVVNADFEVLARRLATASLWDRDNSTIVDLTIEGEEQFQSSDTIVEREHTQGRVMRIELACTHTV